MNSNAMDVSLTDTRVTWHVTGGVIDLYFLMGPSPFDVLDQLTQVIGRPIMPPLWSLGLMNSKRAPIYPSCSHALMHAHWMAGFLWGRVHYKECGNNTRLILHRYGYGSAEFYYQILEGYANASIPLDTFVSDSQYMDHDQDFTLGATFNLSEMQVRW